MSSLPSSWKSPSADWDSVHENASLPPLEKMLTDRPVDLTKLRRRISAEPHVQGSLNSHAAMSALWGYKYSYGNYNLTLSRARSGWTELKEDNCPRLPAHLYFYPFNEIDQI
jgi:hypothetical protein